ncbi:MAG: 16S rRNA (guanine(527)-N(7))-methyltransferase RsmG [Tissierellia bacterium]|jgi:16S rRNA (guanine527-N7)-methyltransferase|nr:16S rRNA (guanine(527)-N(7))-methyltransferase RsmG [Tissierellia bacterium]
MTPQQEEKLLLFRDMVLEKNKVMNLTAITDEEKFYLKHFVDSTKLMDFAQIKGKVLDLGTGAGFPGIPLAILCPDTEFLLMDSLRKRIIFLEEVVKGLNLTNVSLLHSRAEDGGRGPLREKFDIVLTRALAPLPVLLEYSLPFLKVGGKLYAYKGIKLDEEIKQAKSALMELKAKVENVYIYPLGDEEHRILEVVKTIPTPRIYPRTAAQIKKTPL